MPDIPSRELRNNTAGVLRRVAAGERLIVTVSGRPVARVESVGRQRRWIGAGELMARMRQADPGMRTDLDRLVGESTDDLNDLK